MCFTKVKSPKTAFFGLKETSPSANFIEMVRNFAENVGNLLAIDMSKFPTFSAKLRTVSIKFAGGEVSEKPKNADFGDFPLCKMHFLLNFVQITTFCGHLSLELDRRTFKPPQQFGGVDRG